jgi:glutathione S-transferase
VKQETIDAFTKTIKTLEGYLANCDYFAGDELTIADISILGNITSAFVS